MGVFVVYIRLYNIYALFHFNQKVIFAIQQSTNETIPMAAVRIITRK